MPGPRYARLPRYIDTADLSLHATLGSMRIFGLFPGMKDFLLYLDVISGHNKARIYDGEVINQSELRPMSQDDVDLHNSDKWALLSDEVNGLFDLVVAHDAASNRMFIAFSEHTFTRPRELQDSGEETFMWEQDMNILAFYSRGFFCMPCTRGLDHCLLVVQGDLTAKNYGARRCRPPFAVVMLPDGIPTCDYGYWERFFFPGVVDDTGRLCLAVKIEHMITIYVQSVTGSAAGSWEICKRINILDAAGSWEKYGLCRFRYNTYQQKWSLLRFRWFNFQDGYVEVENWEKYHELISFSNLEIEDTLDDDACSEAP